MEQTQSLAILCYAGKLAQSSPDAASLYPTDPIQALLVDSALDIMQDAATKCPQHKDDVIKKQMREEYAAGDLRKILADLRK